MSDSPVLTVVLITAVAAVAILALALYPPQGEAEEGRVLAGIHIEHATAGFTNTTRFTVNEDYQRIGLTYIITEAAYVRASVTSPTNITYEADAIATAGDEDRLELNVPHPPHGTWTFTVWTLDEEERQGYIQIGEFYILGFQEDR
jgi:hypothetical protein